MSGFVRMLPGLLGLIAAMAVGELVAWFVDGSWLLKLLVLVVVYIAVTVVADRALKAYGRAG